jgi:hypothetical protein
MRSPLRLSVAVGLTAISTSLVHAQMAGDVIPDRYIVQLRPGAAPVLAAQAHGVLPIHVFGSAANGYSAFIPPGLLRRVAADPQVEAIIPDRIMTINARPGGGGGGGGQKVPAGVQRIGATPGSQVCWAKPVRTSVWPSSTPALTLDTPICPV